MTRQMTSQEFVKTLPTLTEPVRVKRYKATLGDWFPGGHECPTEKVVAMGKAAPAAMEAARQTISAQAEEIARLKRLLAAANSRAPQLEFRPAPKVPVREPVRRTIDETDVEPGLDPSPWLTAEAKRQAEQRRQQDEAGAAQRRRDEILAKVAPARKPRASE
jgi:hypothetical protein